MGRGTAAHEVLINESYWPQRVTGQQRYAREIAARLDCLPGVRRLRPTGFWASSTVRAWAWVQLVLPMLARRTTVLSLTSRAPLWRRRHVLVVHDLFVLTNPEWYSATYVWTHAPLLRAQIRSAAALVAVSRPVADQLADRYGQTVAVAPNGPSEIFGQPDEDVYTAPHKMGLTPGGYFLAVGNRDPRKNLARLAAAYGQLNQQERDQHPLVLVGGGAEIYRNESINWPVGTVDAGFVTDAQLRQLYRGARSVVLVSLAEGFGLPLVEAAAAGARSFLISDLDVFRWICGEHARYVEPTSVESIAAGLRADIASPILQKVDLDRFSWDNSAAIIRDICCRIAADG
jgi:glycosyltransferase involved in cell wall biosynthesis